MIALARTLISSLVLVSLSAAACCSKAAALPAPPPEPGQWPGGGPVASSTQISIGGATIQVDFAPGSFDLPTSVLLDHIHAAAEAVTTYYGRFPVTRAGIRVVPVAGESGVVQGTTWGDVRGFQGFTRLRIGQHTTTQDLAEDWTTTHELVHMAFPTQADDQHWIEEGLATYVEPLARLQIGELNARQTWDGMVRGMPKGEPRPGDQGLDNTHTWGRTYWGGALFCLTADVQIRRETGNRKSLRDALRAIVAAGGTIDNEWELGKALAIGDRATGTHVLTQMYAAWKDTPVSVDLPKLWAELGVVPAGDSVDFKSDAPLAAIRNSIAGDRPTEVRQQ
ncbi:MAG TPA: hypothetical protein VE291_01355 [Terracidiphilus sp.]|jgi:hypothetical protein|nr:hypothetical protein [Terracidiphilus sp.]